MDFCEAMIEKGCGLSSFRHSHVCATLAGIALPGDDFEVRCSSLEARLSRQTTCRIGQLDVQLSALARADLTRAVMCCKMGEMGSITWVCSSGYKVPSCVGSRISSTIARSFVVMQSWVAKRPSYPVFRQTHGYAPT